jgi:hypothetical protein
MPRRFAFVRPVSSLAFLALFLLPGLTWGAGDPAPTANAGKPSAGGAAATAPAATTANPSAISPTPRPYVPRTPEERALFDLQNETHRTIDGLVAAMNGLNDGPDLRALQLKVVQAKMDYELSSLRIKAQFARARGDLSAAKTAEDRIELILHPKPAAPVVNQRPIPTPDKSDAR